MEKLTIAGNAEISFRRYCVDFQVIKIIIIFVESNDILNFFSFICKKIDWDYVGRVHERRCRLRSISIGWVVVVVFFFVKNVIHC